MYTKDQLLSLAQSDYRSALVHIDTDALLQLQLPDSFQFSLMKTGLHSINYMFWELRDGKVYRYAYEGQIGALGMRQAMQRAWGPDLDPNLFKKSLGSGDAATITALFGDIPDPVSRGQHLLEAVDPVRLNAALGVLQAATSAGMFTVDTARQLAVLFPIAYGQDAYLKRAQLAIMEYAGYLAEQGIQVHLDLTVAADYQLPRVMRALGVLVYDPEVASLIDQQQIIERDSEIERALRSATILGAQAMAKHLGVSEPAVDNFLWLHRKEATGPFHLTPTTDY